MLAGGWCWCELTNQSRPNSGPSSQWRRPAGLFNPSVLHTDTQGYAGELQTHSQLRSVSLSKGNYLQCSLFSLVHCWLCPVISTWVIKTSNVWISLRYPWPLCTSLAVYTHCCVVGHEVYNCRDYLKQTHLSPQPSGLRTSPLHRPLFGSQENIVKHSMIPFYLLHTLHEPSLCCLTIIADIQASVWHKMVCYVLCLPKTTVYSFTTWPHCRWKIL